MPQFIMHPHTHTHNNNRPSYYPPTHTHIQLMSLLATTTVRKPSLHFTIHPPVKIELACMLGETFCSVATDNTGRMESLTVMPLTVRVSLSLEFTPFSVQQVRGTLGKRTAEVLPMMENHQWCDKSN